MASPSSERPRMVLAKEALSSEPVHQHCPQHIHPHVQPGRTHPNPQPCQQPSGHTYRCGNIDEEGVAIYTHYLQERVGDNVHNFAVPPHQESPESKGNKPSVCINRCCCYGDCKCIRRFKVLLEYQPESNVWKH